MHGLACAANVHATWVEVEVSTLFVLAHVAHVVALGLDYKQWTRQCARVVWAVMDVDVKKQCPERQRALGDALCQMRREFGLERIDVQLDEIDMCCAAEAPEESR